MPAGATPQEIAALIEPWVAVDESGPFETQLRREHGPGHRLEGLVVRAIARRLDTDDVLFRIEDGRVAEVHLTWRQTRETDAVWPHSRIFASFGEWAARAAAELAAENE